MQKLIPNQQQVLKDSEVTKVDRKVLKKVFSLLRSMNNSVKLW